MPFDRPYTISYLSSIVTLSCIVSESWAIVWHYLRDPMFSHFDRTIPDCDRQTYDDIYDASIASRDKNAEIEVV